MTWCSVAEQLTPLLEDANYYGVLRMRWCWQDRISVAGWMSAWQSDRPLMCFVLVTH